jgi:hypothetical protein
VVSFTKFVRLVTILPCFICNSAISTLQGNPTTKFWPTSALDTAADLKNDTVCWVLQVKKLWTKRVRRHFLKGSALLDVPLNCHYSKDYEIHTGEEHVVYIRHSVNGVNIKFNPSLKYVKLFVCLGGPACKQNDNTDYHTTILSRVCGDYIRRVLDWQLDLLDHTQLHTITVHTLYNSLQFTITLAESSLCLHWLPVFLCRWVLSTSELTCNSATLLWRLLLHSHTHWTRRSANSNSRLNLAGWCP